MKTGPREIVKIALEERSARDARRSVDVPPALLPGSEGAGEDGVAGARFLFRP